MGRYIRSVITHWMVDVVKALAGWEVVVGINVFESANSQEHPNRRAKSKERLWVESQLWVIDGYLWREDGVENICYQISLKAMLDEENTAM